MTAERYKKLCEQRERVTREIEYFNQYSTAISTMFQYSESFEKVVNTNFFELWLISSGAVAAKKVNDIFYFAPNHARSGSLNMYGLGDRIEANCLDGITTISGTENEDIYICYNDLTRQPDYDIAFMSDIQTQTDISIKSNILNSRVSPIMKTSNSRTAQQIEDIVKNIYNGKLSTVVSENVIEREISGGTEDTAPIFLTTPEQIRNLQYLNECFDVLNRRFYMKYGLNMRTSAKHAQVNNTELYGGDSVSWILPLAKLNERRKFLNKLNDAYNTDFSVDFAEPWKTEFEKYLTGKENENEERKNVDDSATDNADA